MVSASTPVHDSNRNNLQTSHFQQTVCLADWWLVKAENDIHGRGLAVAGVSSREKKAMRAFSSAPILKRYDVFTLETTDGICVILDGFINKDRTLENGFPSDVCNSFLFGFPSYWKEYHEKFMGTESSSKDISGNLLKQLSPHSGIGQTHVDSQEKDFVSQGTMNRKKTKSLVVLLPQKCGSVIEGSEDILNMSLMASEGLEKELYSEGRSGEYYATSELPVNCLKNEIKLLSDSSCGGSISVSAVIDKDMEYSQIRDSRGILSSCHLYDERREGAIDNLRNVESYKNHSTSAHFDVDMGSSKGILSHNEVRPMTRLMSSLKRMEKNNQTSARISGGVKIRVKSVSSMVSDKVESAFVDGEPGSESNLNFEVSGLHRPADEIQMRLLDSGSSKRGFDQVPKAPNQDKGIRKPKSKTSIQKAKSKATKSPHTPAAADNQMDKISADKNRLSKNDKAFDVVTRRKSAYGYKEAPDSGKEIVFSASPQSLSFNRSRSGRLLMPSLEFWRNQRAFYDVDRTITAISGIEEGIQPRIGYGSTSQSKNRKRKHSM